MPETPNESATAIPSGICTLFEGDFHLGLAAFLNSLVKTGYSGVVWAGYRGPLPPWLNQLEQRDSSGGEYCVTDQIDLIFIPIEANVHLTNYKPTFMLELLAGKASKCEYLWYFDPDICLRSQWTFFANWQRYGIALCQEIVDNNLPDNSPLRCEWREIGCSLGLKNERPLSHYYNGGMLGLPAAYKSFLEVWRDFVEYAGNSGFDLSRMMPGNRDLAFHASDQDALNAAAMFSEFPLSTVGPQGMGFVLGDVKMYHMVGQKAWRGSFVLRALSGRPPTNAMKFYLTQVTSPIQAYSRMRLIVSRFACSVAALMGRFYRRY